MTQSLKRNTHLGLLAPHVVDENTLPELTNARNATVFTRSQIHELQSAERSAALNSTTSPATQSRFVCPTNRNEFQKQHTSTTNNNNDKSSISHQLNFQTRRANRNLWIWSRQGH